MKWVKKLQLVKIKVNIYIDTYKVWPELVYELGLW